MGRHSLPAGRSFRAGRPPISRARPEFLHPVRSLLDEGAAAVLMSRLGRHSAFARPEFPLGTSVSRPACGGFACGTAAGLPGDRRLCTQPGVCSTGDRSRRRRAALDGTARSPDARSRWDVRQLPGGRGFRAGCPLVSRTRPEVVHPARRLLDEGSVAAPPSHVGGLSVFARPGFAGGMSASLPVGGGFRAGRSLVSRARPEFWVGCGPVARWVCGWAFVGCLGGVGLGCRGGFGCGADVCCGC